MTNNVKNLYDLVPEKQYGFEELKDGAIDVLTPRYGSGRVGRLLRSFLNPKPVRVRLDDVGASVWRLCDGRRSVYEIGEALRHEFGDRIEPLYDRLSTFVLHMKRNELIDFKK